MILYEIVFEKKGTLYTTTGDVDHSYYCDIDDEDITPMSASDINRLIKRLERQLKQMKENEFLKDFHAKHFGQNEEEEE